MRSLELDNLVPTRSPARVVNQKLKNNEDRTSCNKFLSTPLTPLLNAYLCFLRASFVSASVLVVIVAIVCGLRGMTLGKGAELE